MPFLVVVGLFDSYLEQPDVTAPIVLIALVVMAARDRSQRPGTPAS